VVAAPSLTKSWRRHAWLLWALSAFAVLLALALLGPDRAGSLGAAVAGGPMRNLGIDSVQRVRLQQGERAVTFEHAGAGWQRDGAPLDEPTGRALQAALRLLHNTPPERRFDAAQSDFGLTTPSLTIDVTATDGAPLVIQFGEANPIGLARYARVLQGPEAGVVLLPGDVHDAWLALLQAEPR
jgi:hypothetical protein